MEQETVTISVVEYERLLDQDLWVGCLESVGVDNWEGYDEALKLYGEEKE